MTLTYIFHAGDLNNWYARFLSDVKPGETIYSEEFFAERSGKAERDEEIDPIALRVGKPKLSELDAAYSIAFPHSTPLNINKKKRNLRGWDWSRQH